MFTFVNFELDTKTKQSAFQKCDKENQTDRRTDEQIGSHHCAKFYFITLNFILIVLFI